MSACGGVNRRKSVKFYEALWFKITYEPDFDAVVVMKNDDEVEINLVINGNDLKPNLKKYDMIYFIKKTL